METPMLLINGKLVAGDQTMQVINPATEEVLSDCPRASRAQLDEYSAQSHERAAAAQDGNAFLEQIVPVSRRVAGAVAAQAQSEGQIDACSPEDLDRRIDARWWEPRYRRMRQRSPSFRK